MKTFLCLIYCAAAALWMFGPAAQAQVKIGPPPQPNAGWIGIPVQNYAVLDLSALAPTIPSDGWYGAGPGALQESGKVSFVHSVESNSTLASGVLNEYLFEQGNVTLIQRAPLQQTTPTPDGPMPLSLGVGAGSFLTSGGRLFLNDNAYLRFETPSGDPDCPLIVHVYGWNTTAEVQGGVPRTIFPPAPHDCGPGGSSCNYVNLYRFPWMVVTGANDSGYICGQGTGFCYGKTNPDGTTTIAGAGDYAGLLYGPNKTIIFDRNGSSFPSGSPSVQIVGETFVPQSVNRNGWAINGVILWSGVPQNGYLFWSEHPQLWNGTSLIDIGPGFYNSGRLSALNDQNQVIGSNFTDQWGGEGFFWENGTAIYFRNQLPKNIQGQMDHITPIALSNQRAPAPAVPLEPDRSLCVLTSCSNDIYSRQIWKRDNEGIWRVAYIRVPQKASINWSGIISSLSGINSSGVIAVNGSTDSSSGDLHSLLLIPIEIKVVDRDDPKKKWGDEESLDGGKPVYSGKSCGDMVSFKLAGTDSWTSMNWTWTATGPNGEMINGPTGTGKNEWKIADSDEDTQHDWLDWKPGKYKIRCTISFAAGSSSTVEFEQEIGVRTEEYFVVGTIPEESISTDGVDPRIIQQWACAPGASGPYMIYYALLYLMSGGVNNTNSTFFIPFDEANRTYVNHRLFNASRNLDPASAIKPQEPVTKACGLDAINHYRGFSACQFKFSIKNNKLNSPPQLLKGHYADLVGLTPLFCQSENYAGVKGEAHHDSGKASGAIGDPEVTYLSKFRVGKDGQKGFATLNGRNIPWVFFRFRFEAKDDGLIDTRFYAGASENPNGPDSKDFSKVPTWLVYRRYYDLQMNAWKVEQIRKIDESRRRFFSIGTPIPGATYTLP